MKLILEAMEEKENDDITMTLSCGLLLKPNKSYAVYST